MQAKWEEMFGAKEEVVEEVKVKKPRKKAVAKEPVAKKSIKKTGKGTKQTVVIKKPATGKKVSGKVPPMTKKPKVKAKKSTVAKKRQS